MKKLSLLVPLVFTAPVQASEVTVGQICKAASAAMFGRDHKIMQLDKVESRSGIRYCLRTLYPTERWHPLGNKV
mgnify:CR=1 FL=1